MPCTRASLFAAITAASMSTRATRRSSNATPVFSHARCVIRTYTPAAVSSFARKPTSSGGPRPAAFAVATPAWISSLNFFATSAASNFGMLKIARG